MKLSSLAKVVNKPQRVTLAMVCKHIRRLNTGFMAKKVNYNLQPVVIMVTQLLLCPLD